MAHLFVIDGPLELHQLLTALPAATTRQGMSREEWVGTQQREGLSEVSRLI